MRFYVVRCTIFAKLALISPVQKVHQSPPTLLSVLSKNLLHYGLCLTLTYFIFKLNCIILQWLLRISSNYWKKSIENLEPSRYRNLERTRPAAHVKKNYVRKYTNIAYCRNTVERKLTIQFSGLNGFHSQSHRNW